MLLSDLMRQFDCTPSREDWVDFDIAAVKTLAEAGARDISFLTNKKYAKDLQGSGAGAVLVADFVSDSEVLQLKHAAPYYVVAKLLQHLHPQRVFPQGVHPSAVVHPSVRIGAGCHIGPQCVVEEGAELGEGTVLVSQVYVGPNAVLGAHCLLYAHVSIYHSVVLGDGVTVHANSVIGGDGYGYAQFEGRHEKVPQIGTVRIEGDVEIGSNVSIDRGALQDTVIGEGSKIDNLVQIAHGVQIGPYNLIVSQVGISGSSKTGSHTVLAGQVGVVGHVEMGDQVVVMGKSVVTKDLKEAGQYAGNPAVPFMEYQRERAQLRQLDRLKKKVASLETTVRRLDDKTSE